MNSTIITIILTLLFAFLIVEGGFYHKYLKSSQVQEQLKFSAVAPTSQTQQGQQQWCDRFRSDTPVIMELGAQIEGFSGVQEFRPKSDMERWKFNCRMRDFLVLEFKELSNDHSMMFDLTAMADVKPFFKPPFPGWNPWGEKPLRYSRRTGRELPPKAYQKEHILVMSPSYCTEGLIDSSWVKKISILYTCSYFYLRDQGYGDKTFISIPPGNIPLMSADRWSDIFDIPYHVIE